MAGNARAQLAIDRQRLKEIIKKRDQWQTTQEQPTNSQWPSLGRRSLPAL